MSTDGKISSRQWDPNVRINELELTREQLIVLSGSYKYESTSSIVNDWTLYGMLVERRSNFVIVELLF